MSDWSFQVCPANVFDCSEYPIVLIGSCMDRLAYSSDWGGDVAQLVEHRTGTPPVQVQFTGAARDFSPRVNFRCRLSYGVHTSQCAVACIYICVQVKDPVIHIRVQ